MTNSSGASTPNPWHKIGIVAENFNQPGLVVDADCPGSRLQLVSRHRGPTDTDVYEIRLEDSSIRDANGLPLTCQDLRGGDGVRLQGSINDDETFGHADIVRE